MLWLDRWHCAIAKITEIVLLLLLGSFYYYYLAQLLQRIKWRYKRLLSVPWKPVLKALLHFYDHTIITACSVPRSLTHSLTHSETDRRIRNRHSWTQAITCIHFLQIKPMHVWSSNHRQGSLAFKHVTWPKSVTGHLRQGQTAQGNRHTDRWACPRKRGQRWEGILWSDWATSSLYWLDWASRQQAARGQ